MLEEEKIILVWHGLGLFLGVDLSNFLTEDIARLQSVIKMAGNLGIRIQTEVVALSSEAADKLVQARLNMQAGNYVYVLQKSRKTAGETVIFSMDIFPYWIVKGEIAINSFQGSLLTLIGNQWGRHLA